MSIPKKQVHIIAGGTLAYIDAHLALAAPAYGKTGRDLEQLCVERFPNMDVQLHLTRMASGGQGTLDTLDDVSMLVDGLVGDYGTKMIFLPLAAVDYQPQRLVDADGTIVQESLGKNAPRVRSRAYPELSLELAAAQKVLGRIRRERKDIFAVGFKQTSGVDVDEQYLQGLHLLKGSSANLVLANDRVSGTHMVITPEEARYHVTTDRNEALRGLVEMADLRSQLTFTRSTVVAGEPVPWGSELVPENLRSVVDYCVSRGAYKPFRGVTAGHFAVKVSDHTFLTSRRKTDFNDLAHVGLVRVETDGPDSVIAYGSRPSVGGQSQRIIFDRNPGLDCIVHFHCPKRAGSLVPTVSQREYECGSHQCGENTARGLGHFGGIHAVYLDEHGPNIVFAKHEDPTTVISFIEENFDLLRKTGGDVM